MLHKNFFINALLIFAIVLFSSILLGLLLTGDTVGTILLDRLPFAIIFSVIWTILQFAIKGT
ncbi:hypothetical protein [Alkalicoccobacillus murimartini]|uniref:Membrane-anchored glycerophosphoryl diester phosphodiesterase (GDPDase) n=1 Tax=Alkalicoccobacillus murimartini TaxID=171685 RepID=A0ABT9YD94_9BACI|nr:hypothetical protein [Alkalicoccobacillus murimartini]MDQ0205818.1 membrane-anchored glycerophosphoryl diester phosphodiesterase (GDPDase) [Alkalicoccobacillus murimartini]